MITSVHSLLTSLYDRSLTFYIPPYQRNYEWTHEQCQVFFDDIVKTTKQSLESDKEKGHFFGTITFFSSKAHDGTFPQDDELTVCVLIDGQQRITTSMLFLAALRDVVDDPKQKGKINKYLCNDDIEGDGEYKLRLKQVESDSSAYKSIVLGEGNEPPQEEKNAPIYLNYKFFYNKLSKLKREGVDVTRFLYKGLKKFYVVMLELEPQEKSWENPQEIFESMNSLGKPLSLADLVRNYLLLGLDPKTQKKLYDKYWLKIEKVIPGLLSQFIRDYMQVKKVRSFNIAKEANFKTLYSEFKQEFDHIQAEEILRDLSEYAPLYAQALTLSTVGDTRIDRQLKDLRLIQITTAHSFLLALLKARKDAILTNDDLFNILEAFRIYCLRRRLCGLHSAENKKFPLLVRHIQRLATSNDKKHETFRILSEQEYNLRLPNDEELKNRIDAMDFFHFEYKTFYLALIEESITKNRPDVSDGKIQIEHIMPQKITDEWKKELGSNYETVHQECLHLIGNLTLIRHNQELGQKCFSEKKKIFDDKSGLQIAKSKIIDKTTWTEENIRARNTWLRNILMLNVFTIPFEMRSARNYSDQKKSGIIRFSELGLIGKRVSLIGYSEHQATVVDDESFEYNGEKWKLTTLTRVLREKVGAPLKSKFNGYNYWEFQGRKLSELRRGVFVVSDTSTPIAQNADLKDQASNATMFSPRGLIGKTLRFIQAPENQTRIIDDQHVEFEGKRMRLTPLTKALFQRLGRDFSSRKPFRYWECDGVNLALLMRDDANNASNSDA